MKRLILAALVTLAAGTAAAQTYVNPYVTNNGTYVQGHYRSAPDSTTLNNYGTRPNINPYNGHHGTVNPYAVPQPSYQQPHQYRMYR